MAARRLEGPGAVLLPMRTGAMARAELSIAAIATVCLSLCVRYKYPRCRTTLSDSLELLSLGSLERIRLCTSVSFRDPFMVNTEIIKMHRRTGKQTR